MVIIKDWARMALNPTVLLFFDAEKAFDRIEWWYLKQVLKRVWAQVLIEGWIFCIKNKQQR